MSAETRRRIATEGYRGDTANRRISIATFGYHPLGAITDFWKDIVLFNLSVRRIVQLTFER